MSIRGGPDIIEDGLVLHLDAAEPLCFRGEPTTNLASYTNGEASRGSWPYGAYTHSIETTGEFAGWEKIVATSVGSATSSYIMYIGNFAATSGVQYTGSIEFYSPYNNLMFHITGGQGIGDATRIGSSNKYHRTFATTISTNMAWYLKTIASTPANTAISNGVIYYRRAQFEQKSYYTDFTIGTRGSTVATGGGLLDLTNNGNDGTITRAASPSAGFYNASNGGSFVFDGSNDWILTPYTLNGSSSFTVSCWFKLDTVTKDWQSVVDAYKNPTDRNFQMWVSNQSKLYIWHLGSPSSNSYSDQTLSANTWYNAVFTYGGSGNGILYLNSTITNNSVAKGSNTGGDISLNIGRRADGHANGYTQGTIPIVQVYNRQLSADEVRRNYNATKGRFGL